MSLSVALERDLFANGETIRGRVVANISEKTKIRAITIRVKGKERVKRGFHPSKIENKIIDEIITLVDARGNKSKEHLEKGTHEYPFSYQIPEVAPSSFHEDVQTLEPDQSCIKYAIKACIEIPMGIDKKASQKFRVHHHTHGEELFQNMHPTTRSQLGTVNTSPIPFLSCLSGAQVELKAEMPKLAFCTSEAFRFKVRLRNNTKRELLGISAQLARKVDISMNNTNIAIAFVGASDPSYPLVHVISEKTKEEEVESPEIEYRLPQRDYIRYLSTAGSTQRIFVDFFFEITARFPGIANTVTLRIPVVIHDPCCVVAARAAGYDVLMSEAVTSALRRQEQRAQNMSTPLSQQQPQVVMVPVPVSMEMYQQMNHPGALQQQSPMVPVMMMPPSQPLTQTAADGQPQPTQTITNTAAPQMETIEKTADPNASVNTGAAYPQMVMMAVPAHLAQQLQMQMQMQMQMQQTLHPGYVQAPPAVMPTPMYPIAATQMHSAAVSAATAPGDTASTTAKQ